MNQQFSPLSSSSSFMRPKKKYIAYHKKLSTKCYTQNIQKKSTQSQKQYQKYGKISSKKSSSDLNDLSMINVSKSNLDQLRSKISKILDVATQNFRSSPPLERSKKSYSKVSKIKKVLRRSHQSKQSTISNPKATLQRQQNFNSHQHRNREQKSLQRFPLLKKRSIIHQTMNKSPFIVELSQSLLSQKNEKKKAYLTQEKPDNSEQIFELISFLSKSKLSKNMKLGNHIKKEDLFMSEKISPKENKNLRKMYEKKHEISRSPIKRVEYHENFIKPWEELDHHSIRIPNLSQLS